MTLAQIKAQVSIGVQRDDVSSASNSYADFINDGLREIQQLRSWKCMKHVSAVTMLNGTSSIALPAGFKEFEPSVTPVFVTTDTGALAPIDVVSREQQLIRSSKFPSDSVIRAYNDWQDDVATLRISGQAEQDLVFTVSYYRFLPDLAADSDSNQFTIKYPWMVINKAKALALASINDPVAVQLEQLFDLKFKQASSHDSFSAIAGQLLRM